MEKIYVWYIIQSSQTYILLSIYASWDKVVLYYNTHDTHVTLHNIIIIYIPTSILLYNLH